MNVEQWLSQNYILHAYKLDCADLPIAKLQDLAGVVQAEIERKQLEQKRQESAKIETEKEELKALRSRIDEIESGQNPPQQRAKPGYYVKFKGEEYRKYSGFWWIGDTIGRVGNPLLIRDLNEIYLAQVNK